MGTHVDNIIKFINEQVPTEHQKYFLDRINYVGEDSLNKKLPELFIGFQKTP